MPKQPDATLKFADAEAKLFLRAVRLKDGAADVDGDQVIVQPVGGKEESAVVYMRDGERKVGRIRQPIASQTAGVSPAANSVDALERLDPEEEKRLLGIYDRLLTGVAA